jgi:tetratricopeptide (TPR) repeat protein
LLNDIGCVYTLEGKQEEALRALEEGLALKQKALGRDHPDVGLSEANVGLVYLGQGRSQEALAHLDRAITLQESSLGGGHPELAMSLSNRGETLNALGRHREARASFERASAIWQRELGSDNLNLGYSLTGIGMSYLLENNPASALVPLERAFKIRMAQETEPSRRAETAFGLAQALRGANRDRARANALADRAIDDFEKAKAPSKVEEVVRWRTPGARLSVVAQGVRGRD